MDINFGASISPYANISYPAPSVVNKSTNISLGDPGGGGGGGGPQGITTESGTPITTEGGVSVTTET